MFHCMVSPPKFMQQRTMNGTVAQGEMNVNQFTSPAKKSTYRGRAANESMLVNFFALFRGFYGKDFYAFLDEHRRLYWEARQTNDHGPVTSHYYAMMSDVIEQFYGGSFHFVPPAFPGQSRAAASRDLYALIARLLDHRVGKSCLDIGCGIGTAMADVARWGGGRVAGVTVSANEVRRGNALMASEGMGFQCRLIEGDANAMPLDDASFDSAYAIYALKYFADLRPVFGEACRVLKPGGLFLIYDLVKTPTYDSKNVDHRETVERIEYACGMPPLHTTDEMTEMATSLGLTKLVHMDLASESGLPWYDTFSKSRMFMWLVNSPAIYWLIRLMETFRILPRGFADFNATCMAGTVSALVRGGETGILSGSTVLVFRKDEDTPDDFVLPS